MYLTITLVMVVLSTPLILILTLIRVSKRVHPPSNTLETSLNRAGTSSEQVRQNEQQSIASLSLSSNTREVGTQTGESSQNKRTVLQFLVSKSKKGYKYLTQNRRLGENCINLVGRDKGSFEESEQERVSENLHNPPLQTTSSTVYKTDPFETSNFSELAKQEKGINFLSNLELGVRDIGQCSLGPKPTPSAFKKSIQAAARNMQLTSSGGVNQIRSSQNMLRGINQKSTPFLGNNIEGNLGLMGFHNEQTVTLVPLADPVANLLQQAQSYAISSGNFDEILESLEDFKAEVYDLILSSVSEMNTAEGSGMNTAEASDGLKSVQLAGIQSALSVSPKATTTLASSRLASSRPTFPGLASSRPGNVGSRNRSGSQTANTSQSRGGPSAGALQPGDVGGSGRSGSFGSRSGSVGGRRPSLLNKIENRLNITVPQAYQTYKHSESENVQDFADFVLENNKKQKIKKKNRAKTITDLNKYAIKLNNQSAFTAEQFFRNCQSYYEEVKKKR